MIQVTSSNWRADSGRRGSILGEEEMQYAARRVMRSLKTWAAVFAAVAMVGMADMAASRADEAQAKSLLKAMSDYLGAQKAISFDYDVSLELVSTQ